MLDDCSDHRIRFPDPRLAPDHGLVALGGDYHPERLLAAYTQGIFPWPSDELPFAWFSPDPRMVLPLDALHIPRRLRRRLRQQPFELRLDTAFEQVMRRCATIPRTQEAGTWISEPLIEGFLELHALGLAHSVETWDEDRLVGGIYGLGIGAVFCGESMFHDANDASKIALVHLVERLRAERYTLLDCQVYTDHMASLGAREWPRSRYLDSLHTGLRQPTRRGSWRGHVIGQHRPRGTIPRHA